MRLLGTRLGVGLVTASTLFLSFLRRNWWPLLSDTSLLLTVSSRRQGDYAKNKTVFEEELVPRAFESWLHGHQDLCSGGFDSPYDVPLAEKKEPMLEGLLYLKPSKTASSTTSGVNLRIARKMASRLNHSKQFCTATQPKIYEL